METLLHEIVQKMDIPTPRAVPGTVHKQQRRASARPPRNFRNDFQFNKEMFQQLAGEVAQVAGDNSILI